MGKITLDYSKALQWIKKEEINSLEEQVKQCHDRLHNKTGEGSDYLGALDSNKM